MYIVRITNGQITTQIHCDSAKLKSGKVVKGINTIDSFTFELLPSNPGFNQIHDFQTLVEVYNTNRKRYEFQGRVLYSRGVMDASGLISKEVTCESFFGFLCDSQQTYAEEKNWTVLELLQHIINTHNSQVEDYKHFAIGEVTVTDPNNNLYLGIQRKNTWETIKEKLIDKLGGEIRFRLVDGVLYFDYLTEIGTTKATKIALSRNMKSISKEDDPSAYITRLIPLGCKLKKEETTTDADGNTTTHEIETEIRLDITSVNNGLNYIDDVTAIEAYGIHVGCVEFDDVTEASNLLTKGRAWIAENNRVKIKYSITHLDLSLLGLDIDDFDTHNYHPIENPLMGIDDVARIIKKNIDVCDEVKSTIEVGENFKSLSDIQIEQAGALENLSNSIGKIENDYVTNERLLSESTATSTLIQQTVANILLTVEEEYNRKTTHEEFVEKVESQLLVLADEISMKFSETTERIETVNGELQSQLNTITKYFVFDINGMTIGQVESPYKVVIDNDRYSMLVNGIEVMWIANGEVHTPELTVTDRFRLMGYLIAMDENMNVNCEFVGIPLVIVKQPQSQTVKKGDAVTLTVEATGVKLSYQWQSSTDNKTWVDSGGTSAYTYIYTAYASIGSMYRRCIITDAYGETVTTDVAKITVTS